MIRGCRHKEAGIQLNRSTLCDWFGEHIGLSLADPELEVRTKNKELEAIDQVVTILGQLYQLSFVFLE